MPKEGVAKELVDLIGSTQKVVTKATAMVSDGADERTIGTALELIEFARLADPENLDVHTARVKILRKMESEQTCLMAKSIFRAARIESSDKIEDLQAKI